MDTKSEVFNDSATVTNSPPSYDAISTPVSVDSKRSVFSFLHRRSKKKRRATVLSHIREIATSLDFAPSSTNITPILNSCAAALSAAEFSDLLQQPNIEDHTALYWAIVNNRREAFEAFAEFIPQYSHVGIYDLRRACMTISDNALFMHLDLGSNANPDSKDASLRHVLGCPQDMIQVHEGDGLDNNRFTASFCFGMFQKRLRIARKLNVEFVARGRIWELRFFIGRRKWRVEYSLTWDSLPVHSDSDSDVVLLIEAHAGRRGPSNYAAPAPLRITCAHVPAE
ncbi:hypothetical protein DEU56DRAFT_915768 [Suillus clintonianus]|uniref:uncharacterized protein n=1 Tax=Suillus clintonianus TaxID=1904413 RepID=UPI001B882955|nr:uncharacterized protein DEU56DRAFT_915768 [Suillus clintonianus]KAG2127221.1 hypothetical protein DEU56DRAFT_915768 [Suillus clintonianus]